MIKNLLNFIYKDVVILNVRIGDFKGVFYSYL